MTIRTRLTWIFAISALLVVLLMGTAIYVQVDRFHERAFTKRLQERVALTELIFLEKNAVIEEAVRNRFLQTLDSELEYVIPYSPAGKDTLNRKFGPELATRLYSRKAMQFTQGKRTGFSKHYVLPEGEFIVIVTAIDTFGQTSLNYLKKLLLGCAILSLLVIGLASYIGTNHALRPLKSQIEGVRLIGKGKIDHRLPVPTSDDEISQLAKAFNSMLDSLQNSFQAQRQFVRNASHEMRTPLTAIKGEAELMLDKDRSNAEYRKALGIIRTEANRLQLLIAQLLDLEKAESLAILPNPRIFPIDQCLLEAIDAFPSERLQLDFDTSNKDHFIYGSAELMRTALSNIVDNALKYSGHEMVRISFTRFSNQYLISIQDKGIGIPSGDFQKIFQPFFRSSNARNLNGHGIGLSLAHRIITLHKGELSLQSEQNHGTTVTITFPSPR